MWPAYIFKMSFSKRIAVTAGFTKCHDTKDPGYMHNSRLYAQWKLTWEYKVTISSQLGYTLCIFLYYISVRLHTMQVYSKLPL